MDSTELIAVGAIVVVAALIVVVSWQLAKLRNAPRHGPGGAQLPSGDLRQLEDGAWEIFLVRDEVHRSTLAEVRFSAPRTCAWTSSWSWPVVHAARARWW